ncbi:MAG TPA: tyrosine-type recombinase/integrase, partial [Polyangiaceae bacterium]|nr:tyrosine-type recombinase/integrase [Polyangiaceae bacterium]
ELAAVADETRLGRIRKGVDAILAGEVKPVEPATPLTDAGPSFREFAEEWTSGRLHVRFPDHVKQKKTAQEDVYRLEAHVYPVIGELPITLVRLEDAERVMRKLDSALAVGSRRQVSQLIHRVLSLAAYPARLIEASPIPEGFLPKPIASKVQAWLYPAEEASLLACREVPLLYRLLYGFLAREGMRRDEALLLTWNNVDLVRGTVTLEENKTDDPRAWVLGDDVTRALSIWRDSYCADVPATGRVFAHLDQPLDGAHLAAALRTHLQKVGGIRAELFERTARRAPIRAHDLRATFVTLALASSKTETWVCDRTGHRSSQMLNKYRRAARTAAELGLGWLIPLDEGIPEFAAVRATTTVAAAASELPPRQVLPPAHESGAAVVVTARDRLVGALTEAVRDLMRAGDSAGARIAINTLLELASAEPRDESATRNDDPSPPARVEVATQSLTVGKLRR